MADDEEAVVLACKRFSYLCSRSASETTSGKSEVDMSTPVHAVTTPLNKYRASRTCRARREEHVAPRCPTCVTQHVTTFSCAKIQELDSVACREIWA